MKKPRDPRSSDLARAGDVIDAADRAAAELERLGAQDSALAFQILGRAIAAIGRHAPGWSGSLAGPLTKRALGGLH